MSGVERRGDHVTAPLDVDEQARRLAGFDLFRAPTRKRPLRDTPISVILLPILGVISPFVALGILGGAALQRLHDYKGARGKPPVYRDRLLVLMMLIGLLAFPLLTVMTIRGNEAEVRQLQERIRLLEALNGTTMVGAEGSGPDEARPQPGTPEALPPTVELVGRRVPALADLQSEGVADNHLGRDVPQRELDVAHERGDTVDVHRLDPEVASRVVTAALKDLHDR